MCCGTAGYGGTKRTTVRLTALVACAVFIAALVLSAAFIALHIDHEHNHSGADGVCSTCAHIVSAENLLRSILTVCLSLAAAAYLALTAKVVLKSAELCRAGNSLIRLKVRIDC